MNVGKEGLLLVRISHFDDHYAERRIVKQISEPRRNSERQRREVVDVTCRAFLFRLQDQKCMSVLVFDIIIALEIPKRKVEPKIDRQIFEPRRKFETPIHVDIFRQGKEDDRVMAKGPLWKA